MTMVGMPPFVAPAHRLYDALTVSLPGMYSMPNVGQLLKDEIARISRREIKKATSALYKSSANFRREIASLKRRNAELERALKVLGRDRARSAVPNEAPATSAHRFSASGFRTLRHKLGLSAAQISKLIGVSMNTVFNWETKATSPRPRHLASIVRLRHMGKREVSRLLERQ